jgi:hypothetical protein
MEKSQEENLIQVRSFFMKGMCEQGGTVLIASIANILACGLNSEEVSALSSFIVAIGDTMGYISAQRALNQGGNSSEQ